MTDQLDTAIRDAFDDIVADMPPLGPLPDRVGRQPSDRRRTWLLTVAAALLVVVGAGATVLVINRDTGPAAGGLDVHTGELAVAPGITDYYVGPESLGEPDVDEDLFQLNRCVELDDDGTCTAVLGPRWTPFVSYGQSPTMSTTPVGATIAEVGAWVTVETILGGESPAVYAAENGTPGEQPTPATIRDHDGLAFNGGGQSFVVWEERPDVVVVIGVAAEMAAELPVIAEGVRRVDGPATIPDVVVIPGTRSFRSGNSADGLVVTHTDDGTECVGMRFFEEDGHCPATIEALTWLDGPIEPIPDDEQSIVGATPRDVTSVRVTPFGGAPFTADTFAYGDYEHRFFQVPIPPSVAVSVEWLAADGSVVAATDRVSNGSGYGGPAGVGVMVIDGSGAPGAGEQLAARLTGPYRGELAEIGVDAPSEIGVAADGVAETVVYYNHGFFGDPPGTAVLFAERLGAGPPQRASEELTAYYGTERSSDDLIVVLGADLGPRWAPSSGAGS